MNRSTALLSFILSLNVTTISAIETDMAEQQEDQQFLKGQPTIFLDEEVQKKAGIQTVILKKSNLQLESIAFGKAISVSPLLSILNKYLSASTKQAGAKARFTQAKKNISRLRNLHRNEAISTRKLQAQQSQWQSDKAIYNENILQSKKIINDSRLVWGEKLTQWATTRQSPIFNKLSEGKSTLLQITLPVGQSLPPTTESIFVNPTGERNNAYKASYISQLPTVNPISQGLQYIFLAETPHIQAGMNFSAWIPQQKESKEGVVIPQSSLVWHLGQAFVFIKMGEESFIHRNIAQPTKVNNGYFVQNELTEGEEIVSIGTQMLLSHEFRSQIPSEDDDDD